MSGMSGMSGMSMGSGDVSTSQDAYLECTPAHPQFDNADWCTQPATGPKMAVDRHGDMIPVTLRRTERGSYTDVEIDRLARDTVWSFYHVTMNDDLTAPMFVGNAGGGKARGNGVRIDDLNVPVGDYSTNFCTHPPSELTCPGMTSDPVQPFRLVPGDAETFLYTKATVMNRNIRLVVKYHGPASNLGNTDDNAFVNQNQDFDEIAYMRLDAPECGTNGDDCPNWYVATFMGPGL
eukprot:m.34137 g.34137  ORF g.34137 m.34137 type:complete len:235 (-) comp5104_c0_seq1:182-886(-)